MSGAACLACVCVRLMIIRMVLLTLDAADGADFDVADDQATGVEDTVEDVVDDDMEADGDISIIAINSNVIHSLHMYIHLYILLAMCLPKRLTSCDGVYRNHPDSCIAGSCWILTFPGCRASLRPINALLASAHLSVDLALGLVGSQHSHNTKGQRKITGIYASGKASASIPAQNALGFHASQPRGDRVVWGQPNWKLLQQKSPGGLLRVNHSEAATATGESIRATAMSWESLTKVPDASPGPSWQRWPGSTWNLWVDLWCFNKMK